MKNKIILLTIALVASVAPALRADGIDVNLFGEIRLGRRPPPPPPAVIVVVQDDGPRESAGWERRGFMSPRSQGYYYYPGGNVYYRQADRVWFYQERGRWRSGRHLPDSFRFDFNHSVTLNMYTSRPYSYHQQVVARYPSDYFVTRVRLRDERRDDRRDEHRDNRRDNDHDGRDSDRDGRDKDKGNGKGRSNDHRR